MSFSVLCADVSLSHADFSTSDAIGTFRVYCRGRFLGRLCVGDCGRSAEVLVQEPES